MRKIAVFLILTIISVCSGQTINSAKTTAPCSPIVTGDNNNLTCGNLTKEEARQLADILNAVRNSNVDLQTIKSLILSLHDDISKVTDPYRSVSTYEFNGWLVTRGPGITSSAEGETPAYKEYSEYEATRNWAAMAALAEREKIKAPLWLTPWYMAAEAYDALCDPEKEKENRELFIQKADGIFQYRALVVDAKRMKELRDSGQTNPWCQASSNPLSK